MKGITIRSIRPEEIDKIASFIATGYAADEFFKWCVNNDENQHEIVTGYYKVYLNAKGRIAHVAENDFGEVVGATVWLPHDVDASIYDDINKAVGIHADNFQAVADASHDNEPTNSPFYQLVAVVVDKKLRNQGIGGTLLKHQIDYLDKLGISTYLEASTPYYGGGVYGKFGYQQFGELMEFAEGIVLYPLFRSAKEKKTAFIWDESYFWHNAGDGALFEPAGGYIQGNGSVESPESKRRVINLLERSGLISKLTKIKAVPATEEQLQYFHTKGYIETVKQMSKVGGLDCGDSAIVGKGSYSIAKLTVGGAIEAVKTIVESDSINKAYVLARPPGHHAEVDRGVGFCIFNNIVIAAKYAQKELDIKKIVILDWDAHHGNGTEDAFYNDDSVLFISIHQDGLEPIDRGNKEDIGKGKGKGFTLNIPLHAGSGDAVYKYAFEQIVIPAIENFKPELILISAGQDASIFDPLARMMLSTAGYRYMTKAIKELADIYAKGRIVCLHEGGYCPAYVPFCTHAIIEELSGITTDVEDPFIYAMAGTTYRELLPHQKERVEEVRQYLWDYALG